MLDGSREAPTTATDLGWKKGRSEAAVATRSRISRRATLVSLGTTDRSTSISPPSSLSSIAKPDSRKTSRIAWLSACVTAQKRVKPFRTASRASRSSNRVPSPLPCRASSTAKATSAVLRILGKIRAGGHDAGLALHGCA